MVGVLVTFRLGDTFDELAVRKVAETARARFEGMPGLRSKAFTVSAEKREATNFYVYRTRGERSALNTRLGPAERTRRTRARNTSAQVHEITAASGQFRMDGQRKGSTRIRNTHRGN